MSAWERRVRRMPAPLAAVFAVVGFAAFLVAAVFGARRMRDGTVEDDKSGMDVRLGR